MQIDLPTHIPTYQNEHSVSASPSMHRAVPRFSDVFLLVAAPSNNVEVFNCVCFWFISV